MAKKISVALPDFFLNKVSLNQAATPLSKLPKLQMLYWKIDTQYKIKKVNLTYCFCQNLRNIEAMCKSQNILNNTSLNERILIIAYRL